MYACGRSCACAFVVFIFVCVFSFGFLCDVFMCFFVCLFALMAYLCAFFFMFVYIVPAAPREATAMNTSPGASTR